MDDLLLDYDPIPGLVARGVVSNDHDPDSCEMDCCRYRTHRSVAALYSKPRVARKRRRCDGHLAPQHYIEPGDLAVRSALPPDSEIGNTGWWHHTMCMNCTPNTKGVTDD